MIDVTTNARNAVAVDGAPGHPIGWWGVWLLVTVLTVFLGGLVASALYLRSGAPSWPPAGVAPPEVLRPALGPLLVAAGLATLLWARRGARTGALGTVALGALAATIAGAGAIGLRAIVHVAADLPVDEHAYGSLFHVLGGFDVLVSAIAVLASGSVVAQALREHLAHDRRLEIDVAVVLWILALATSTVVYGTIHLLPLL